MDGVISSHKKTGLSSKKIFITITNQVKTMFRRDLFIFSRMSNKKAVAEKLLQINAN